jgi:hypothetical protein
LTSNLPIAPSVTGGSAGGATAGRSPNRRDVEVQWKNGADASAVGAAWGVAHPVIAKTAAIIRVIEQDCWQVHFRPPSDARAAIILDVVRRVDWQA